MRLGYAAAVGAVASLLFGTVSLSQAVASFFYIWDAALAFVGIVALSVVLDAMGFFRWAALRVVRLAGGSGLRLYYMRYLTHGGGQHPLRKRQRSPHPNSHRTRNRHLPKHQPQRQTRIPLQRRLNRRYRRHAADNQQSHQHLKRRFLRLQLPHSPYIHGAYRRRHHNKQHAHRLLVLP